MNVVRAGRDLHRLIQPFHRARIVVRQFPVAVEAPSDLQKAVAHQRRSQRNRHVYPPHGHFEIGRSLDGMADMPDKVRAHDRNRAGEQRSGQQTEQNDGFLFFRRKAVDQHVHAHMDAGAHAIRRAELGHPHEHIDAEFLRPAQVERQQPVLQARNGKARHIAIHDGNKNEQGRRRHQNGDQRFFQPVEHAVEQGKSRHGKVRSGRG